MKKITLTILTFLLVSNVYSQILSSFDDQKDLIFRIENNIKRLSFSLKEISKNRYETTKDRNSFVQAILQKDRASDEISNILSAFLQKHIKDDDSNLTDKLSTIHKMLNICFEMKQSVDNSYLQDLKEEFRSLKKLQRPT